MINHMTASHIISFHSISDPPPGSGMSIAKQFLLTILTQFAERRVFVYLLRHNHESTLNFLCISRQLQIYFPPFVLMPIVPATLELKETVFSAIAICLNSQVEEEKEEDDEDDLNLSSLVEHFLEVRMINVNHCWGRAHTSVYLDNLRKVISQKHNMKIN